MEFRVLIADDEAHIREQLKYIIDNTEGYTVIDDCEDGTQAIQSITALQPDIVLLDIRMSGLDGIKLGEILDKMKDPPTVIYVTAYEEYALKALNIGARGYVLKPFSENDMRTALDRVARELTAETTKQVKPDSTLNKVATQEEDRILFHNQQDIVFVQAKNRKVYIVVGDKEYKSRYSLSELEKKLDSALFFRCHRNYLVNMNMVVDIVPWFNNSYMINLRRGEASYEVPLSRDNVKRFKSFMDV